MSLSNQDKTILRTSAGDFPLNQYCLRTGGREWKILHVSNVLSHQEESKFLLELSDLLPYGVTLWTASIALAHDVASRGKQFGGTSVLELGAGTGMPGIVAASHGARVVQTDRNELAISVCKRNIALNGVETIEQRVVDWTDWNDSEKYDWILGSDILYGKDMHPHLRRIFESNLAADGRILLSDPFRSTSFNLLESLEADGWTIKISKWNIGEESAPRPIGVFELSPR
jgi:predicted nicotinamide N-methyase